MVIGSISILLLYSVATVGSKDVSESTSLTVGLYQGAPWGWLDSNGKNQGVVVNLIDSLIKETMPNSEIHYVFGSTERIAHEVLSGRADIVFTMKDDRLENYTVAISDVLKVPLEIWSLNDKRVIAPDRVDAYRIATSVSFQTLVESYAKQVLVLNNSNNLIRILLARRAEGVMSASNTLEYQAYSMGIDRSMFYRTSIGQVSMSLWCNKKSFIMKDIDDWKREAKRIFTIDKVNRAIQQVIDKDT